jgi:hypothetical protein
MGLSGGDVAFLWLCRNGAAICGKAAEIRGVFACGKAPAMRRCSPLSGCE